MLPIPLMLCFSLYLQTTQCYSSQPGNNVCKTIPDYKRVRTSRKCYHNPDVGSTLTDMVKRNGYPVERHEIVTPDGYILTVSRIFKNDRRRQPVVIQHGIGASAAIWVLRGRDSLAFFLYDNGYDVWLPNIRGSTDSTGHVKLSNKDKAYWDFEFEDIALNDLPSIIDKVASETGQKGNIIYMGHSMGTTVSYIYCSSMKSHCEENLKGLVSFSPVAFLRNIAPQLKLVASLSKLLINTLYSLGMYEIGNEESLRWLVVHFCSNYPTIVPCTVLNVIGTGLSLEEVRPDLIPVIVSYFPVGISLRTLEHYAQNVLSGAFQRYDYGEEGNLARYNSTIPPDYDLGAVALPVYLFVGQRDAIADEIDVDLLRSKLTSVPNSDKFLFNYAHNDFFAGRHVKKFYDTLQDVLRRIGNR